MGTREGVQWFRDALEARFEIKTQCIGPGGLGLSGTKVGGSAFGPTTAVTKGEKMLEGTEVAF